MVTKLIIFILHQQCIHIQYFTLMEPACFIDFVDFTCIILSRFAIIFGCEIHVILCDLAHG